MHAIAYADACRPKPFTSQPYLMLVLASQMGTAAAYVQRREPGFDIEELDNEARALEAQGSISQEALDADWTLDEDAIALAAVEDEANEQAQAFDDNGMEIEEIDTVEEVEPIE